MNEKFVCINLYFLLRLTAVGQLGLELRWMKQRLPKGVNRWFDSAQDHTKQKKKTWQIETN